MNIQRKDNQNLQENWLAEKMKTWVTQGWGHMFTGAFCKNMAIKQAALNKEMSHSPKLCINDILFKEGRGISYFCSFLIVSFPTRGKES